jgi:hypothetical protein
MKQTSIAVALALLFFTGQAHAADVVEIELNLTPEQAQEIQRKLHTGLPGAYTDVWATEEVKDGVPIVVVYAEMANGINHVHVAIAGTRHDMYEQVREAVTQLIKKCRGEPSI